MSNGMLMAVAYRLNEYMRSGQYADNFDSKELADVVVGHAAAAGVAAMTAGTLPGVGGIVASGISVAAIWSMYVRLAAVLKLKLRKDSLKALASAVLANIITQLGGVLVLEFALSFVPVASSVAVGVVNFGVTYVAGLLYLKALTKLFAAGVATDTMTAEQLKAELKQAASTVNAKEAFQEAKTAFTQMRKDDSLETTAEDCGIDTENTDM